MMKNMKQIILSLTAIISFAFSASAGDRPVAYNELPLSVRTFIESTFPSVKVMYSVVDDDIILPDYTISLENGIKVQFTNSGRLEKVDAGRNSVPYGIIPVQICDYLKLHYPDAHVTEYEMSRRFYEVRLSNRMELKFNRHFSLVEIDD